MVDEESPIFKEVANAPAPITQRIADMIIEETLVRFTTSGCVVENKVACKHSASCVFFSPLFLPTFVASL